MRMKWKKMLSLVLALVCCFTALAMGGGAAGAANYTVDLRENGTIAICSGYLAGEIDVPDGVIWVIKDDGKLLKYLGHDSKVVIPDEVVWIGPSFEGHEEITEVVMPDSVKVLGSDAFAKCTNLASVRFSKNLETIGTRAFYECKSLTSLDFPSSLRSIESYAFYNCGTIDEVTFREGLHNIDYQAFYFTQLPSVVILPSTLEKIDASAIYFGGKYKRIYLLGKDTALPPYSSYMEWVRVTGETSLEELLEKNNSKTAVVDLSDGYKVTRVKSTTTTPTQPTQPTTNFTDVRSGDWFAEPVQWAVLKGITTGTSASTFSPEQTCTQAQIVTFLYRAMGEPAANGSSPYADVSTSSPYYKALCWAQEKGLLQTDASGKSSDPCTRSDTVLYLWKLAGKPETVYDGRFEDVSSGADYAQAVAWAVEQGITTGTGERDFSPGNTCTRAQIVTFLYRDLAK